MKNFLITLILLTFYSCQTKTTDKKALANSVNKIQATTVNDNERADEFCDSTKIKDFKSNLIILNQELTDNEREYQQNQAKNFIKNSCSQDTLYCGEFNLQKSTIYQFDNEWKLLLTGYIIDQSTGMEEKSASFFVLTIMRNNEFWFTDILDDLMGEIQVELNGFENKDRQVTVWGHAYPYFESDYGKFRLTINNGAIHYEFQCHAQH